MAKQGTETQDTETKGEGGTVDQLRVTPPTLEDVFIYLSEQAYE